MENKLKKEILKNSKVPFQIVFTETTDLIDDLGYDSIDIISLVVNLEETFGIELPDDYLTMDNLRSYINLKKALLEIIDKKE